jgi:hypothetical protein
MKTLEMLNKIHSRIKKHPDYDKEMRKYYQLEMVKERYEKVTDEYFPGQSSIPQEERGQYYDLVYKYVNRPILCMELMKSLLTEEDRKDSCQKCMDIFMKSISVLKEQLLKYKDMNRVCFAHSIFCRLDIPYTNLREYDSSEFLLKLFDVQVRKMKNMKRQDIRQGLSEYYYPQINSLDAKVFDEDERLPAAIILEAYEEHNMSGMKNARYFSAVVANELQEIVDDDTIAEIVKKLISHDHICGEIDGKYHFLLRDW